MSRRAEKQIWVYCDLRNEKFLGFSLNVLAKARELAQAVSGKAAVVFMGSSVGNKCKGPSRSQKCISFDIAKKDCIAHGADLVYFFDNPRLAVPRADIYALALGETIRIRRPILILFALTEFGRELAARTARANNAGLIADCADLRIEEDKVVATCPSWGGEVMAEITFSDGIDTGFATVQPHAFQTKEICGDPGAIEQIQLSHLETPRRLKLISCSSEPEEQQKLEEADIVVVGGAGLGNADGFALVRELAAALQGEVGATRPPLGRQGTDDWTNRKDCQTRAAVFHRHFGSSPVYRRYHKG